MDFMLRLGIIWRRSGMWSGDVVREGVYTDGMMISGIDHGLLACDIGSAERWDMWDMLDGSS